MSYPEICKIEKEQVEWVFGLTGGELADKPLRFAEISSTPYRMAGERKGSVMEVRRWWRSYFYDGVPEYVGREHRDGASYITIVTCLQLGNFGVEMPRKIITGGKVWRRVAVYTTSGECECPRQYEDENKVTEAHVNREATGTAECVLCGEALGEKHGVIYLGDGWAEVVYRSK